MLKIKELREFLKRHNYTYIDKTRYKRQFDDVICIHVKNSVVEHEDNTYMIHNDKLQEEILKYDKVNYVIQIYSMYTICVVDIDIYKAIKAS